MMPLVVMTTHRYSAGMNESQTSLKFKLAAIDLDGTLLGPDRILSPANVETVGRLRRSGVQVVLASGRHFRSMLPHAKKLPKIEWLVSSQGGEVSNVGRTVVGASEFLSAAHVAAIIQVGNSLGFSPVAYGVDGVLTAAAWNADLEFYSRLDGLRPAHRQLNDLLSDRIFKVIWTGSADKVEERRRRIPIDLEGLQTVRTDAHLLEFMPAATSKGAALSILAQRLDVRASETLAFGDGDNDVPMFQWAGLSVAMAHGWPAAVRAASHIAPPGPPETALAGAVDFLFSEGLLYVSTQQRSAAGACSRPYP